MKQNIKSPITCVAYEPFGSVDKPSHLVGTYVMENEIWKDIIGFEGLYMVSNFGRVKALSRYADRRKGNLKEIIKKQDNSKGYKRVELHLNGVSKKYSVHRLVGIAFIPNPNQLPIINHIDCNPGNNHYSNLEWTTQSANVKYAYLLGRAKNMLQGKFGKENYVSISIEFYNSSDELEYSFGSISEACRFFNKDNSYFNYYIKNNKKFRNLTIKTIKKHGTN